MHVGYFRLVDPGRTHKSWSSNRRFQIVGSCSLEFDGFISLFQEQLDNFSGLGSHDAPKHITVSVGRPHLENFVRVNTEREIIICEFTKRPKQTCVDSVPPTSREQQLARFEEWSASAGHQ